MNWSGAGTPLAKSSVQTMMGDAFKACSGLELSSFAVEPKISFPKLLNTDVSHPSEKVAGDNSHAKLYSSKDYVYPFATFSTGYTNASQIAFEGEILQTSPGHGEFVSLSILQRNTDALFDLGEKFLGQGSWEKSVVDQVNSMNTEERGQVYRRIFRH